MKKYIIVIEAEGGTDKWINGHRRDTIPIIDALKEKSFGAEVIYFRDEWVDELFSYIIERADAVIVRINPGNLQNGEEKLFDMLDRLSKKSVLVMTHPTTMMRFGAKDALYKLSNTDLVPDDTYAYYTYKELKKIFPKTLSYGPRVLKQNRGSTGSGIWKVEVVDNHIEYKVGESIPDETVVKCTEAFDNHVEYHSLGNFIRFCKQYIKGKNGMIVDMRFLPRITEGEIRILMVGNKPIFVVHKKPADQADAFSATIGSGAHYTYFTPDAYPELVSKFVDAIPLISERLGKIKEPPILWTGDFMLDNDDAGNDSYVLGEINCSCVGFFSHLDMGIQEQIAEEVINRISQKYQTK